MTATSMSARRQDGDHETTPRERILEAAFAAFMENGYGATSTLEIATRARVSKRELYALVGNKLQMLIACITERAGRLQVPADLPVPRGIMRQAVTFGLVSGRPIKLADQFGSLLLGDLMISLLLGVASRPSAREIAERARDAAAVFLQLHPPTDAGTDRRPRARR
jgi:AcrR family transcriptional regulator